MHSRKRTKNKKAMFYSRILPFIQDAVVRESTTYPIMEGIYQNYAVKIVPKVDTLTYRSLPRLYIRVYIMLENERQCRIVKTSEREYLCPPADFEKYSLGLSEEQPELKVFLAGEPDRDHIDLKRIENLLSNIDEFSEILMRKKFIRATFLITRGERSYYTVLRAAEFPDLALESKYFNEIICTLLKLREEVAKFERAS